MILLNTAHWLRNQGQKDSGVLLGLVGVSLATFSLGGRAPHTRHWFRPPAPGPGAGSDHVANTEVLWGLHASYLLIMTAFRHHAERGASFNRTGPCVTLVPTFQLPLDSRPALVHGALVSFWA